MVPTWSEGEAVLLAGDPLGGLAGHVEEAEQDLGHLQVGLPQQKPPSWSKFYV